MQLVSLVIRDRHSSVPFMLFAIDFLNAAPIYVLFFFF